MRKFSFRLEAVQRLRTQLEQQCRIRLGQAMEKQRNAERAVFDTYSAIEMELRKLREHKESTEVNVDLIMSANRYVFFLRRRLSELFGRLKEAEAQVEEKRKELVEARRDKRSLEILRDRHFKRWRYRASKEEQNEFDEMATLHRMSELGKEKVE